ncbi:Mbov_0396 family ICE element transmembrane protein [Spiroplasma endosymbiont of Eupeodes luniger]|uniref:Mbov_0396 family ICE element transmembrane protein n=1 Tax=Spiroplasma endosymbiont of Eupeodes luniger TaxID=3066300 RepID=UPI0030CFF021
MLQKKKGLKNPFIVGKSAKIKPTSINNIIAIVNNVIKKMAMFLIITFLPLMLIAVIIVVIIAAIMAIFVPDTINNFTTAHAHASELLIKSSQLASDSGSDAPSWLLSSIMNAVFAILYLIFIKPLLWLLNKFQDIIYFMSGGNLANRLLFENNNPNGAPMLFIVMVAIAGIILALLLAGQMIEIMLADEKNIKLKSTLRNMILLFIAIPTIPIIFFTLNIIVNLLTQAIMQATNFNMQNIGLFIFNSSFDNGMHNFDYVPASWTFADSGHFNYLMCLFSEGFMIYIFLLISLFLFWRTAELLILYVLSPIVIVSAIQHEGRRFRNWKELAVARFLSFNMVFLAYSLFLWSITVFAEIGNAIPDPTTRPIFTLLGVFAFGIVVVKSPQLLSSLMGGNTSLGDGVGNIMGLKVATSAFMSGGVMVTSGVRTSYSLSKKTASGLGFARAIHQGAKDYGFKNIAKAQMKTAFTGDYVKGNTKATAKINQWFNDK